ncbi:hypothetical protein HDU99_006065, partial [Rhizoclosmatium hyalinum]
PPNLRHKRRIRLFITAILLIVTSLFYVYSNTNLESISNQERILKAVHIIRGDAPRWPKPSAVVQKDNVPVLDDSINILSKEEQLSKEVDRRESINQMEPNKKDIEDDNDEQVVKQNNQPEEKIENDLQIPGEKELLESKNSLQNAKSLIKEEPKSDEAADEEDSEDSITAEQLIKNEAKQRLKSVREEDLVWHQGDDEEFNNELRERFEAVMQENMRKKQDVAIMRKRKRNERRKAKLEKERAMKAKLQAHREKF